LKRKKKEIAVSNLKNASAFALVGAQ
jgi:hypothetical protein